MRTSLSPKFVVIGGGTGSFTLLNTLKYYVRDVTALVSMADNGGSTGQLRDELGVLPPGDIRQCLVALSESSQELRDLFNFRFPSGTFAGHSFGNLFLSAVEKMTNNFGDAIKLASEVLNITGQVLPVTLDNRTLILKTADRKVIKGQYEAETYAVPRLMGAKMSFNRAAKLNPEARKAIMDADMVVIAPGNLYTSLAPALIVKGMRDALKNTNAKVVYVCNLVNKAVHTIDYSVSDYAGELERFIGAPLIDFVLYNIDEPSEKVLKAYALDGEFPVAVHKDKLAKAHYQAKGGKFLSRKKIERDTNDTFILRSLIRHDSDAVARALMRIYYI